MMNLLFSMQVCIDLLVRSIIPNTQLRDLVYTLTELDLRYRPFRTSNMWRETTQL